MVKLKTEASIVLKILIFIDKSISIPWKLKQFFLEKNKLFSEISMTERSQDVMKVLFKQFFIMVNNYCFDSEQFDAFWKDTTDYNVLMNAVYYNILEDVLPSFNEKNQLVRDLFLLQNKSGNNALMFSIRRPVPSDIKRNHVAKFLEVIKSWNRSDQIKIFSCQNIDENNVFSVAATLPHQDVSTFPILNALLALDLTKEETKEIFTDNCLVYVMKYLIELYSSYSMPSKVSNLIRNLNLTDAMMLTVLNKNEAINVTILKIFAENATDGKVFKAILNRGSTAEDLPSWVEQKSLAHYIKLRQKEDISTGMFWAQGETKIAAAKAKLAGQELTWVQQRALNSGRLGNRCQ